MCLGLDSTPEEINGLSGPSQWLVYYTGLALALPRLYNFLIGR